MENEPWVEGKAERRAACDMGGGKQALLFNWGKQLNIIKY